VQITQVGEQLKREQQQHDLTRLKLSQAEASLRDALSRATAQSQQANSVDNSEELQQQVDVLRDELHAIQQGHRPSSPTGRNCSWPDDAEQLRSQVHRLQQDAHSAEEAWRAAAEESSALREQLTEANQRVLVCHT
jgi:predicted nuclease with TOPRIM domain